MSFKKKLLITIILILGWVFTVWLAWNLSIRRVDSAFSGSSEVSSQFLGYVSKGEFEKAYNLTSDVYKSETTLDQFSKQLKVIDDLNVDPSNVSRYRGDVDYLTQYQFTKDDGKPLAGLTVWAEQDEDGKWLITTVVVNR
jgi:hypothetical protein